MQRTDLVRTGNHIRRQFWSGALMTVKQKHVTSTGMTILGWKNMKDQQESTSKKSSIYCFWFPEMKYKLNQWWKNEKLFQHPIFGYLLRLYSQLFPACYFRLNPLKSPTVTESDTVESSGGFFRYHTLLCARWPPFLSSDCWEQAMLSEVIRITMFTDLVRWIIDRKWSFFI